MPDMSLLAPPHCEESCGWRKGGGGGERERERERESRNILSYRSRTLSLYLGCRQTSSTTGSIRVANCSSRHPRSACLRDDSHAPTSGCHDSTLESKYTTPYW